MSFGLASNMLIALVVSARTRSLWYVLVLLGIFALARGQCALTNVYAVWSPTPAWDNPYTVEVEEINTLVSVAVPYSDPIRDAGGRHTTTWSPVSASLAGSTLGTLPESGCPWSRCPGAVDSLALSSRDTRAPPGA
jgi:hypothetical protein